MRVLTLLLILTLNLRSQEMSITDPLADFLTLPIEDRYTDASEIVRVHRVEIDLDQDGIPEQFIGHHKMWWGDNNGIYWAIYKKSPAGYLRMTPEHEDVRVEFHGGDPRFLYVGAIEEQGGMGMLVAEPYPGDPYFKTNKVEGLLFIGIDGGTAQIKNLPGLEFDKVADKTFFERYFGKAGHQGGFRSENFNRDQLERMGYKLPDWKTQPARGTGARPPRSNDVSSPSTTDVASRVSTTNSDMHSSTSPSNPAVEVQSDWRWLVGGLFVALAVVVLLVLKRRKTS